jgi:hypothetical protein
MEDPIQIDRVAELFSSHTTRCAHALVAALSATHRRWARDFLGFLHDEHAWGRS